MMKLILVLHNFANTPNKTGHSNILISFLKSYTDISLGEIQLLFVAIIHNIFVTAIKPVIVFVRLYPFISSRL